MYITITDDPESSNDGNTLQDETCGSTVDRSCQSPLKCFSLFFSEVVLDFLKKNTNEYAMKRISTMKVSIVLLLYCIIFVWNSR